MVNRVFTSSLQPAFYERDGVLVQPPSFEIPMAQLAAVNIAQVEQPSNGGNGAAFDSVTPKLQSSRHASGIGSEAASSTNEKDI